MSYEIDWQTQRISTDTIGELLDVIPELYKNTAAYGNFSILVRDLERIGCPPGNIVLKQRSMRLMRRYQIQPVFDELANSTVISTSSKTLKYFSSISIPGLLSSHDTNSNYLYIHHNSLVREYYEGYVIDLAKAIFNTTASSKIPVPASEVLRGVPLSYHKMLGIKIKKVVINIKDKLLKLFPEHQANIIIKNIG